MAGLFRARARERVDVVTRDRYSQTFRHPRRQRPTTGILELDPATDQATDQATDPTDRDTRAGARPRTLGTRGPPPSSTSTEASRR